MRSGFLTVSGSHGRAQIFMTLAYLIEMDAIGHVRVKPALLELCLFLIFLDLDFGFLAGAGFCLPFHIFIAQNFNPRIRRMMPALFVSWRSICLCLDCLKTARDNAMR